MFTVRKDQMIVLEAMALENFMVRLRTQLAGTEDGAATAGRANADALLQEVQAGVALARSFHLKTERDVAALVTMLKNHLGSCAPDLPRPALSILTTWGVAPEDKLRRFAEWASRQPRVVADGQ
ncbi:MULTISPECIES: hypothetical protein [unclassified Duganella]|uniref:hypothetical protein n=1 Tax=unclassified Duganella TaxID=2636909 RepID=UPI000E35214B|nr:MULTISPECIES: hypothetical protein [unclassified Duganella]RFP19562.1 hypothetical protein D0T23_07285 [Duganella sp. BJB475]RFP36143.1 hypothetical protein D0T21_06830 [Duganella sp. BJB476]